MSAERKREQQRAAAAAMLADPRGALLCRPHASDCGLHNGPALLPIPCTCGAEPSMTPERYGSECPREATRWSYHTLSYVFDAHEVRKVEGVSALVIGPDGALVQVAAS